MDPTNVCPWQGWDTPVLEFCEEALCAWVKTPANAWSSLAFTILGIYILWRELRTKNNAYLVGYGPMCIMVGLLSWFYHASLTRLGEIGDLSSMFLIGNWLAITNMERMGWMTNDQGRIAYWLTNIISTVLLFFFKDLGAPLFFIQCMLALGLEIHLRSKGKGPASYKFMTIGFFFWITAQTIWVLDLKKIVCNPQFHVLQGHAAWHVLMAGLAWFIYLHYNEIRKRGKLA